MTTPDPTAEGRRVREWGDDLAQLRDLIDQAMRDAWSIEDLPDVAAESILASRWLAYRDARIRAKAAAQALRGAKKAALLNGDAYLRDPHGGESTLTVSQLLDHLAARVERGESR